MSGSNKDDFQQRYEQALEGLAEDYIAQVAQLDYFRLHEWVDSPAKVRPFLLQKWQAEDQERQQKIDERKQKNKKRWFDLF